jgi:acetyltransferase-like isoleucine patch superfamily enzyme
MIHPTAIVEDAEVIGADTNIWAYAHVMAGARIGNHCNVGDHAFVETGAVVVDNVTLKNNVLVWEGITIKDNVFVGPGVIFTNDRFPRSPRAPQAMQRYSDKANWLESTLVQHGCAIGAGATICPGITLGRYSMIGAGSVVTEDVEPFSLVIGSPARHRSYVCSCGQKLAGHYLQADCLACGETVARRGAMASPGTMNA